MKGQGVNNINSSDITNKSKTGDLKENEIRSLKTDISNSVNIYDILAAARKAFGAYSSPKTNDYVAKENDALRNRIVGLWRECDKNKNSCPNNACTKCCFFRDFQKYISYWLVSLNDVTFGDLYKLIRIIDANYYYIEPSSIRFSRNQNLLEPFSALNKNSSSTGLKILPRLNNTLTTKMLAASQSKEKTASKNKDKDMNEYGLRNLKVYSDTLNSKMNNYDFIKTTLDFSPTIHRFTTKAADKIAKRLKPANGCREEDRLTVGLFPLWRKNIEDTLVFDFTETQFSVKDMDSAAEEAILEQILLALKRCGELKVDIAIFPEMLMTRRILEKVQEYIGQLDENALPILMVMGSVWETCTENESPDHRNVSVVLSCWGDVLIEQQKQTPYPSFKRKGYKKEYEENLSHNDNTLRIIDIDGVGRFSTLICRDALNPTIITIMKDLRADVLFVPAFSASRTLPDGELLGFAKSYLGTVLLCNSCSARSPDSAASIKKICLIMTPAKSKGTPVVTRTPLNIRGSCDYCLETGGCGGVFDIYYNNYSLPDPQDTNSGQIVVKQRN